MTRIVHGLLALVFAAATITVLLAIVSPPFARLADRAVLTIAERERHARYRLGLPLRGTPDLDRLEDRLEERGLKLGAPVFIRIFKREFELELWMQSGDRFVHFATYPICRWSGRPGPKLAEGDRQAPEGFYTVARGQLNPASRWHRSFDLGFPNAYDRANGRTGSFLMVHGGCSSIGCYAVTNPVVDEIWRLVTAALDNGQARFAVHAFPFRMSERNLRVHGGGRWDAFWYDLQQGYDLFEASHVPPAVRVCDKRYAFEAGAPASDGGMPLAVSCAADPATS